MHKQVEQLKDPVCGMDVSTGSEHHQEHNGQSNHFCNEHCLHKFREDPEQYIDKESSPPHSTGDKSGTHTCPMHPTRPRNGRRRTATAATPFGTAAASRRIRLVFRDFHS